MLESRTPPGRGAEHTVAEGSRPAAAPRFGPPARAGEVGTLGPYRVLKPLGKGGMGLVYLALDARLHRTLALKVMPPELAADRDARERFVREARAAARVAHDNVVTVYEADERDGVPYIAMQLLEGCALDRFLKARGAPALPQVVQIGIETASGLAAAHAKGLIHRDIKPGNLWLESPRGRVKVLDFGLAKPIASTQEATGSGLFGTPAYMSPEQARGQKLDARTDLFSLGAVLYRVLADRPPFAGDNVMDVLVALGTEDPPPLRSLNPAVPEPLAALVHQLLAKHPDARPQTADEVAARLNLIARALADGPRPAPAAPEVNAFAGLDVSDPDATFADATLIAPTVARPAARRDGRRGWLAAGLAAVGLAAVVGLIAVVVAPGKKPPPPTESPSGVTASRPPATNGAPVPGPAPAVVPSAKVNPDLAAARQVFALGGQVQVNGGETWLGHADALPRGPFDVTAVKLTGRGQIAAAELECLRHCERLTSVEFGGTHLDDAAVAHFRDIPLKSVGFTSPDITDAGVKHLSGCPLITLGLAGTGVTDDGLKPFAGLTELGALKLGNTGVTDAGLAYFANCQKLTELSLPHTKVTDAGLKPFRGRPALVSLNLMGVELTDAGLAHFVECPLLGEAFLSGTKVTDAGLAALTKCRRMGELDVRGTPVTRAGAEAFAAAVPHCRVQYGKDQTIAPRGPALDRAAALFVLERGGRVRLNDRGDELTRAADLPNGPFALTGVWLESQGRRIDPAEWERFAGCTRITVLSLDSTHVGDAGLSHFSKCAGLEDLRLGSSGVTDVGLKHVAGCAGLLKLGLSYTEVTDDGLLMFVGCQKLGYVNALHTRVTPAGADALRKAVPGCNVEHR